MNIEGQEQEGLSMSLRRARGAGLITAPIAVEIARLVLKEEHGQRELDQNEPFSVTANGDIWVVQGRDSRQPNAKRETSLPLDGPFEMRISKFNGQIFECSFVMHLPSASLKPPTDEGP